MLINRIFSGNDAVYGLTEKAVNDAVQQHGADKADDNTQKLSYLSFCPLFSDYLFWE